MVPGHAARMAGRIWRTAPPRRRADRPGWNRSAPHGADSAFFAAFATFMGSSGSGGRGPSGGDVAEPAVPGADASQDHKRGGVLPVALPQVGTVGLLAHGVELQVPHQLPPLHPRPPGYSGLSANRVSLHACPSLRFQNGHRAFPRPPCRPPRSAAFFQHAVLVASDLVDHPCPSSISTRTHGNIVVSAGYNEAVNGYPLNSVFGYRYVGKVQNQDQLDYYVDKYVGSNSIALPANLRLGDHMYEDVNKDGKLTQDDLVFLGSDDPKYSFSFNFGCEWKGFDFNTVFQGVGKRTIYREIDSWKVPFKAIWLNTTNQSVGNVWSPETPNNHFPTYSNSNDINNYNYIPSTWSADNGGLPASQRDCTRLHIAKGMDE